MAWTDLLQRVFEVDALGCPRCGARMRVLSAIADPDVARRILDCLRMPSRAPTSDRGAMRSIGEVRIHIAENQALMVLRAT